MFSVAPTCWEAWAIAVMCVGGALLALSSWLRWVAAGRPRIDMTDLSTDARGLRASARPSETNPTRGGGARPTSP